MKIKGQITILISRDYTKIEIRDDEASTTFVEITLTPEQLSQALSRQAYVDCKMEVHALDRVGKKHENKSFEFELPEKLSGYSPDREKIADYAQKIAPEGWVVDRYFGSQNSFYRQDGKDWARATIRRWI